MSEEDRDQQPSVFISYAEADRGIAEVLHSDLALAGAKVFQFSKDARVGTPSWGEILKKISSADTFIVLVSADSNQSRPVQAEIEHAYGSRINIGKPDKIVPAILSADVPVPIHIVGFTWLPLAEYDVGLSKLCREIGIEPPLESLENPTRRDEFRRCVLDGWRALDAGLSEEAARFFGRAVYLYPGEHQIRNNLGVALLRSDDRVGAEREFRLAIASSNGSDIKARLNLAYILCSKGRHGDELSEIRQVLEINRANPGALVKLGGAILHVKDYEGDLSEALAAVLEALELDSEVVQGASIAAIILDKNGEYDEALKYAMRATNLDGKDAQAWNARGRVLAALGRYPESFEALDRACQYGEDARYNRGVALALLGRFEEALQDIRRAYENGFADFVLTLRHPYLETLRQSPIFGPQLEQLVQEFKDRPLT